MRTICFVTTGDIKTLATAKRALGMARPLARIGWKVFVLMEDTEENRHRTDMECGDAADVRFFPRLPALKEAKAKSEMIREIKPDFVYLCAFVARNIVSVPKGCRKIVEHSELQSGIPDMKGVRKIQAYVNEYYSVLYADGLVNASKYLQDVYAKRSRRLLRSKLPMLYHPYAYSKDVIKVKSVERTGELAKYKDRKVFVFLGTVTRNYGAFTMIDAIAKVRETHPEALLLMLGRGRHYDAAQDYVRERGLGEWVVMPGFIAEEEISTYFSLADYFVSPMNDTVQDWARCPSKLYMYLPYRKPVVTCRIGENLQVLGDEGTYYEPSSSESMAESMRALIESGKTTIAVNPEEHSWDWRTGQFDRWISEVFPK